MSDPQTQQAGGIPLPPQIPGGDEVYDRLMSAIEPDLVTAVLPTLEQKYANETQQERDVRMERYKKAFLAYQKAHAEFLMSQEGQVRGYKKNMMSSVEQRAGSSDINALADIESQMSAMNP